MSSFGPIVLNYGNYILRNSELQRLQKKDWLNDVIIGFYFEYLEDRCARKDFKFLGPEIAQLVKFASSPSEVLSLLGLTAEDVALLNVVLIPINDEFNPHPDSTAGGSHWSLLVFSRFENLFIHYDSLRHNEDAAKMLFNKLKGAICPESSFLEATWCQQQNNGSDCGLHVLGTAEKVSQHLAQSEGGIKESSTSSPADAAKVRQKLLKIINQQHEA